MRKFEFIDAPLPEWDYDREKYWGKITQPVNLPDGLYNGMWSGYEIRITAFALPHKTDVGRRGPWHPYFVEVKNGIGLIPRDKK